MTTRKSLLAVFFIFFIGLTKAWALEAPTINGFLTAAASYENNDQNAFYYNGIATEKVRLDTFANRVGLQIASKINNQMKFTTQLLARGGPFNYQVHMDWAYVNYQSNENLDIRIGKYKIPQFIVSDYFEVGYAYPWVRPPLDVYSTNPLISISGLDFLYKYKTRDRTTFLLNAYYGDGTQTTFMPARTFDLMQAQGIQSPVAKGQPISFQTNQTVGVNISAKTDIWSFRIGYFQTKVDSAAFNMKDVWGSFGGVGFTMDWHDVVSYAEYIARDTAPEMAGAFPDQNAWYVTLGYRINKFLPIVTLSRMGEGKDKSDFVIEQHSVALGFRYDFATNADFKFEAQRIKPDDGNHGLFSVPVDRAMVYTATFDIIF